MVASEPQAQGSRPEKRQISGLASDLQVDPLAVEEVEEEPTNRDVAGLEDDRAPRLGKEGGESSEEDRCLPSGYLASFVEARLARTSG